MLHNQWSTNNVITDLDFKGVRKEGLLKSKWSGELLSSLIDKTERYPTSSFSHPPKSWDFSLFLAQLAFYSYCCAGLIEELKQKVDESKTECAYQLRLKDNQNLEQIKEINKKARMEKDSLGKNINGLQQEIGNLTKDNEGKLQKVGRSFKRWSLVKSIA